MFRSNFLTVSSLPLRTNKKLCTVLKYMYLGSCKEIHTLKGQSDVLSPFNPPDWIQQYINEQYVPKNKVKLSMYDTPIHEWELPGVPKQFLLSIKRDDMTGSALSGNKVRKLEFLMADAIQKGCKHVITCGSLQSNHCRAVAVAARQLGLTPHLLLRSDETDISSAGVSGNVLLNLLCRAYIYLVPKRSPYLTHLKPRMERLSLEILKSTGEASYLIPVGGSNSVGLFGYLSVIQELQSQGALEQFDDLVFACGSGGTAAGLCIGNHLTGSRLRLHAIAVSDNASYFYQHINETLREIGLGYLHAEDLLCVVDGHKGKGYGISTDEELEFIVNVANTTGVMLDPTYSGKAALGLVHELRNNAPRFKGRRSLFLHTGGIYSLFDGRMTPVLGQQQAQQCTIKWWPDINSALQ